MMSFFFAVSCDAADPSSFLIICRAERSGSKSIQREAPPLRGRGIFPSWTGLVGEKRVVMRFEKPDKVADNEDDFLMSRQSQRLACRGNKRSNVYVQRIPTTALALIAAATTPH